MFAGILPHAVLSACFGLDQRMTSNTAAEDAIKREAGITLIYFVVARLNEAISMR